MNRSNRKQIPEFEDQRDVTTVTEKRNKICLLNSTRRIFVRIISLAFEVEPIYVSTRYFRRGNSQHREKQVCTTVWHIPGFNEISKANI